MADRPSPFDGIEDLLERLNRQFETATRSWETGLEDRSQFNLSTDTAGTSLDLADEGSEFVVTVDVPGYETDDIDLRLSGDRLSITGEREQEVEEGDEQFIRQERKQQSFSRQLRLPEPVVTDDVEASLNNGVLTVRLPKHDPSTESQSIDID
ncbi:Hsp20/alpha crystallin family protein [Halosolutus halophilus]|uniref:Hsp20/alpha crystallin family protein n=1 Tax=Halosolutus halophilus TaxID=1552990 RepID=UPI0022352932|nr:Hsp20/alpha crystallin family protein [Halosolutus halophilus]